MFFSRIDSSTRTSWCCTGAASMSSQKKARGLPGMKEGPLVQMLDRQRVQQAATDEAKKLVDAAALATERLVDDDRSFIVLTETKFSFRCIPVWDRYSPHRTRVEKKKHM
jgi:hypothetical protein